MFQARPVNKNKAEVAYAALGIDPGAALEFARKIETISKGWGITPPIYRRLVAGTSTKIPTIDGLVDQVNRAAVALARDPENTRNFVEFCKNGPGAGIPIIALGDYGGVRQCLRTIYREADALPRMGVEPSPVLPITKEIAQNVRRAPGWGENSTYQLMAAALIYQRVCQNNGLEVFAALQPAPANPAILQQWQKTVQELEGRGFSMQQIDVLANDEKVRALIKKLIRFNNRFTQ